MKKSNQQNSKKNTSSSSVVQSVKRGLEQSAKGQVVDLGRFSKQNSSKGNVVAEKTTPVVYVEQVRFSRKIWPTLDAHFLDPEIRPRTKLVQVEREVQFISGSPHSCRHYWKLERNAFLGAQDRHGKAQCIHCPAKAVFEHGQLEDYDATGGQQILS